MDRPPIAVMSFNRPHYLRQVLELLVAQDAPGLADRPVYFFQDNAHNRFSGRTKTKPDDVDACVRLFRDLVPHGTVMLAPSNLGVALNFLRAERFFFEELKVDCAYFFEDDLILAPRYLALLDRLKDQAAASGSVGYFAAYGHLQGSAEHQHQHARRLRRLGHLWGFGLFRRHWLAMQPLLEDYYSMVKGIDYQDRPTPRILQTYRDRGMLIRVSSQDDVKKTVTYHLGKVALNTELASGRYIGAVGIHMKADRFEQAGYDKTVWIDPGDIGFDFPDDASLARMIADERIARHQSYEADKAAPAAAAPSGNHVVAEPRMPAAERRLFDQLLASGRRRYAEFGVGGSTLLAARQRFEMMVGIDSDPAWAKAVREHAEIAPLIAAGSASILHANIGPVGTWGSPVDPAAIRPWPNYIGKMWAEWGRRNSFPDLVFVDGRFRVSCCLSVALLAAAKTAAGARPLVMMRDITEERPKYRQVLDFFDVAHQAESLFALTPKPDVNPETIVAALFERIFDVQ